MNKKFQYVLVGLPLLSCSEPADKLSGENLYSYTDNSEYFPKPINKSEQFSIDWYVKILKQLDEKSLIDNYHGHEIIRLTVVSSFSNHFTILIESTDNGVHLTEKETYRNSRSVNNGDTTKITYDIIEFDSLTGKYFEVRKYMPVGAGPIVEIETERKIVNPLLKDKSIKLRTEDWNNLAKLLSKTSFWAMHPADTSVGFDGDYYILETHTKDGYYVVERWSPENWRL
jgi:hypothetical protein